MSAPAFTSQRHEDQILELCLRCDLDTRELLFGDRALQLCAAIAEKRMGGHADWFSLDDVEELIALYGRSESHAIRSEVIYTLEFIVRHSHDEELVQEAQGFLGQLDTPIVSVTRRRILER